MAKHTPGPWRTTKTQSNVIVNEGGDKWIARAFIGTKKSPRFICDPDAAAANASLMAAAPDLVEVVRDIVSDCKGRINQGLYELAVAALAKAEGR